MLLVKPPVTRRLEIKFWGDQHYPWNFGCTQGSVSLIFCIVSRVNCTRSVKNRSKKKISHETVKLNLSNADNKMSLFDPSRPLNKSKFSFWHFYIVAYALIVPKYFFLLLFAHHPQEPSSSSFNSRCRFSFTSRFVTSHLSALQGTY